MYCFCMKYRSDDPESIRILFERERDHLRRAGFEEPNTSESTEGFERPDVSGKLKMDDGLTMAERDPTGINEYGPRGLRYTERNSRHVQRWREEDRRNLRRLMLE